MYAPIKNRAAIKTMITSRIIPIVTSAFFMIIPPFCSLRIKSLSAFLLYLTKSQLAFLRNAIYAFHGYKFKNKTYSELFSSNYEHWYKINPKFTEKDFNEIEKANINLIKKYEER